MAFRFDLQKRDLLTLAGVGVAIAVFVTAILLIFNRPSDVPISNDSGSGALVEQTETSVKQTEAPAGQVEISTEQAETPVEQSETPAETPTLEDNFDPDSYAGGSYYIKVNRQMNVVMVYALDDAGEYTRLAKTFVSSVGREGEETPLGVFSVADRYEVLYLVGDVWGRFAVRIDGPYFFHSVPYFTKGEDSWDDLEYLEYNKLGQGASAGCVRLAVSDARWIYDHIPYGTTVEIYDSPTLPDGVVKPTPIHIDENSPTRGHDPTDY